MTHFPVMIPRFKPVEILEAWNPDKPIGYQEVKPPMQLVSTADDVIELGQQLYEAEEKAWEGRFSSELVETVIDGAIDDLMDVARYLETLRGAKPAREAHQKIMMLILRMKAPLIACIIQCFEGLYTKGGTKAVKDAVKRITCKHRGDEE